MKSSEAGNDVFNDEKAVRRDRDEEDQASAGPVSAGRETGDEEQGCDHDHVSVASTLPFSKAKAIGLVVTVSGASFLNTLSSQAVVIILPTIGRDLNIPGARLQWIISAYSLAFGCCMMLWGRIADVYGKRKIFVLGSAWVAVTTVINPFLPNEIAFDLFRGLQGLGAAANVPTAIGILGTTFAPGKAKNYAFSFYAAGAPLGAVFGNILGGVVASYASWKWVFGLIAILALCVTIAGIFVIPPPNTTLHAQGVRTKTTVDWLGALLITAGLLCLLFALTEGNVVGWSKPWIPVLIVVSVGLVALFAFYQRYLENTGKARPLMKVSVFHSKKFSAAMLIMLLFFSSFNGFLVFATYYFQDYQGLSPIQTTIRFIPEGICGILTAAVVSQLLSRVPTYIILLVGNISVSISCLLFAVPIPGTTTYWAYCFPAMLLSVFGADTAWPSLTLFTSHSLPAEDQALGGALVNSMGQVGRSVGLAIATAVQMAVMARERGTTVQNVGPTIPWEGATWKGISAGFWFHTAVGLAAFAVTAVAFRGSGIIGKAGVKQREKERERPGRSGGEEAVMEQSRESRHS